MEALIGIVIFFILFILIYNDRYSGKSDRFKNRRSAKRTSPKSKQSFQSKQEKSVPNKEPGKAAFLANKTFKAGSFSQLNKEIKDVTEQSIRRKQSFDKSPPKFQGDKSENDVLKSRGDGYELHIGRKFELKGDLVIYNGFIRGYEDQGVDVIVLSKSTQSLHLIQCKHWKKFEFTSEHLYQIYNKLNYYTPDYQYIEPENINQYLSFRLMNHEVVSGINASLAFSEVRKTLYLSNGNVVQDDVWKLLERISDHIYRYKDMKIVIHPI